MLGADKTLTIRSRTASVNAEGQVTYSNSDTSVRGRITQLTVSERSSLTSGPDGMRSNLPEAIAWVPLTATITDANHYRCHLIGVLT